VKLSTMNLENSFELEKIQLVGANLVEKPKTVGTKMN
jgi:hypothetical protein